MAKFSALGLLANEKIYDKLCEQYKKNRMMPNNVFGEVGMLEDYRYLQLD